jgi:hypothetical protein
MCVLGESHPDVAISLNNLAKLYQGQGRNAESGVLYSQALDILRIQLGEDHPITMKVASNLASLNATSVI